MFSHEELIHTNLGPTTSAARARRKAASADTALGWTLVEIAVPPYWAGIPWHQHADVTEVLYVLQGILACTLGDITTTASPGSVILIPPQTNHTIWNPTATSTSYLTLSAASGCCACKQSCHPWGSQVDPIGSMLHEARLCATEGCRRTT